MIFVGKRQLKTLGVISNHLKHTLILAGARYTKSIASLELRRKEHNNDPYSLFNNTIDFPQ